MTEQPESPSPAASQGRSIAGLAIKILVGIGIGMVPFALLVILTRQRSSGLNDLIDALPDPQAKAKLIAMGPRVANTLKNKVYHVEHPNEQQLAMIDVVVQLGRLDELPIFVRRAHFVAALDAPDAESRLYGLRGLATLGRPFPASRIAELLDDTREATAPSSPALPYRKRKGLPPSKGIVSDEAADFLVNHIGIDPRPPRKEGYSGPPDLTGYLTPEQKEARFKRLRELIAQGRSRAAASVNAGAAP